MRRFVVWGRPDCSYCHKATTLLRDKGETFSYFNVREHPSFVEFMRASGMPMTVPQVFMGGHLLGGYDELADLMEGWAILA